MRRDARPPKGEIAITDLLDRPAAAEHEAELPPDRDAAGRETPPEGFAGPNDMWHYHEHVCIKLGPGGTIDTPFGAELEGVTADMCTDAGGAWIANTGYMVHLWNVPGYESPDGMFTELNRRLTCPDGTYHRIPLEELGTKDTACRA